ncbi:ABC transporter substrate-binding protein [Phaeovulum sp. W22_SRMD_FR3]|uniref:ABC transporter substrate-binding protein n=1 Tax=Phaeovulum sp. W22_SRMD_FR3 TaxID=3240274 RepID=UPI003F960BD5
MKTLTLTAVVMAASLHAASAEQATLVINSYGGPYEAVQRQVIFEPFEKAHDVKIQVVTVYSADMLAQLRAQKDAPQFDLVQFSGGQEILAAREGLLAPVAPEALSHAKDLYPFALEGLAEGRGPVTMVTAMGLIYNEETAPKVPSSWKDLWDPAFADHVVLTDLSNTYGLQSFMMMNRVWGGDMDHWQPGLDKVSEIIDGSVVITSSPEIQQNFAQNDAWIAPFAQDYAHVIRQSGLPVKFVVPSEGSSALYITMNAVAGRPQQDLADQLIDFSLSPEVQAAMAREMRYSPTNRTTELPDDIAAEVAHGEGLEKLVRFDPTKLVEIAPKMIADWKQMIAR